MRKLKFSEKGPKNPDPGIVDSVGYSPNVLPPTLPSEGISSLLMGPGHDPGFEPSLSKTALGVLFSFTLTGFTTSFLSGNVGQSLLRASRKDFLTPIKRQRQTIPSFPFVSNLV